MTWDKIRPLLTVPLVVLIIGFGFSLVANVASTWDSGPIRVLGGALASLALPASIHLWPKVPIHGSVTVRVRGTDYDIPVRRIVRAAVMTLIAALAAVTTFRHVSALLVAHGETAFLAMTYPIVSELVVVMAALAHRAEQTPKRPAGTRDPRNRVPAETTTSSPTPPAIRAVGSSRSAQARAWIHAELDSGREPTASDVDAQFKLSGTARVGSRELRKVLSERERTA